MAGYTPLKITGPQTGLVQNRENFLLPDDAYPTLNNAYVWRERIKRKQGFQLLGRVQREIGTTDGAGNAVIIIAPLPIQPGIASFVIGDDIFTDPGGASPVNLLTNSLGTGTLNRATGTLTITGSIALTDIQYYPGLPIMGIRTRESTLSSNDITVVFDQAYAYVYNSTTQAFQEFIPGTTWNAHAGTVSATDFFWSTNYWVSDATNFAGTVVGTKLFWVTNNTGQFGALADPPRITDGVTWLDFNSGTWNQLDAGPNYLTNWATMLPFRGRMLVFNTWEGPNNSGASSLNYSNRIRWARIGNPFIPYYDTMGPNDPSKGSWRDDIRGQGGFLDIPTSEDIIAVGFVRDNLVIYCERSTWQLRYTGRSIAPFQIERVNSELGAQSAFSAVQFDTSLMGIGDKGVVECDSYKSERIDVKIPDLIFTFQNLFNGVQRIQGIRDFINRLAYWTYPSSAADPTNPNSTTNPIFPTNRLVYNYENDSWAIFSDSLTALGTFQPTTGRTWLNTHLRWIDCNFSWIQSNPAEIPLILGGNQQGFVEILDQLTANDPSLFITDITSDGNNPDIITSPNHNMHSGFVIGISGIPTGANFDGLNDGIYGIVVLSANTFQIYTFDPVADAFIIPVASDAMVYQGGGLINIRENFSIVSKKFNFLDEGKSFQIGYLDILLAATEVNNPGAITLKVYLDYDDVNVSNTLPRNQLLVAGPDVPDPFFNQTIPTAPSALHSPKEGSKFWQRVYCPTQATFVTLEYTLSNAQLAGEEQTKNVEIDAQVLWVRRGGRMTSL